MAAHDALDETMCNMPVCQHPQCWAAFRRIERGNPHYSTSSLGSITRSSEDEGGLPVLTVSNFQPPTMGLDSRLLNLSSSLMGLRDSSSPVLCNFYNKTKYSLDKVLFPDLNSSRESEASPRRTTRCISPSKLHKIEVVDMSAGSASCHDMENRHISVVWVPNSQRKCQRRERKKEQNEDQFKVGIKDVTFETLSSEDVKSEDRVLAAQKRRNVKRHPTGGCSRNMALTSVRASVRGHAKSQKMGIPPSSVKGHIDKAPKDKQSYCWRYPDVNSLKPWFPGVPLLQKRHVVLHDTKERQQHVSALPSTGPVYKLDDQRFEALNEMEIDLESIRNQYYLWKKYISRAGPSGKVRISGSVSCNTDQSFESDGRDFSSVTSLSQCSGSPPSRRLFLTDLRQESGKTAAAMESNKESDGEILKAQAEVVESPEPVDGEDTTQSQQDLQQVHVTGGVATRREKLPPVPPESTDCVPESNQDKAPKEQGAPSLQPPTPPSSPTHN